MVGRRRTTLDQLQAASVETCWYGHGSGMRKFPAEGVVLLDGVRCTGADHDGCQKACNIFWRETWLRKIETHDAPSLQSDGTARLRVRLKTVTGPNHYFCQSSEILNATVELSKLERFSKCVDEVRSRNSGIFEVFRRIAVWTFWKDVVHSWGLTQKGRISPLRPRV